MDVAKKLQQNNDLQRAIMKGQEKVISQYRKRLNSKFQKELQTFASSGKQVGSSEFFKLSPLVREIVVKMSIANLDAILENTKNPFKKLQYWIAKGATQKLASTNPKKKKKKKKKVAAKTERIGKKTK